MSSLVSRLMGFLMIFAVLGIIISTTAFLKTQSDLDTFADELASQVSIIGKAESEKIEKRYNQLKITTGLEPSYSITADRFVKGPGKKVQYGEAITVTIIWHTPKIGIGDFKIPLPFPMKTHRIVQSMQYWKED